jgi:hypothetical protein
MIVYGISDRDLAFSQTTDKDQIDVLPNPRNIILDWLDTQLTNFQDNFYFLNSPKLDFLTLAFARNHTGMKVNFTLDPATFTQWYENRTWPIANDTTLLLESKKFGTFKILPLEKNENFIALNEVIAKLQKNKILILIFIVPQERYELDKLPSDAEQFNLALKNITKNYPNVRIYSLWDKYADLHIWIDSRHIVWNTSKTNRIYSDDIAKIIETYLGSKENETNSCPLYMP